MLNASKDRNISVKALALMLVLVAGSCQGLLAQSGSDSGSFLLFPRISSNTDLSSGMMVFNPSAKEASVTFILRNADGNLLTNGKVTVPPRGQVAKTASELFPGVATVDGSVFLISETSGLVGYYQSYNGNLSILEGTGPSELTDELLFPVVPRTSEGAADISLHNPNARPTAVDLSLWSHSGTLLSKASVRVPAGGVYHNSPENLFSSVSLSDASHITGMSRPVNIFTQAQSISGTSTFAGFSSVLLPAGSLDLGALNAQPLNRLTNTGVIPHFRTGFQYASIISLANVESASIQVTLSAIGNDGTTLGTRTVSIPAKGGLRSSVQSLFPILATGEREGWILLQGSGRVHATVLFGKNNSGSLSAIPIQQQPMTDIVFPQVLHGSGNSMEILMVNAGPKTTYAGVYVVHSSGATLASNRIAIPPGSRIRKSLSQLMPEIVSQSGGFVYIDATDPIFSAASIWIGDDASVSSFVPQAVTVPYQPGKLSSFAVTGFVTLNGNAAQGMRVVLSGPVSAMATTGPDGSYGFSGLPAGRYSMGIDQSGFEFFSTQVNFEITNASIRQDFQGYTGANAIVVHPGLLPVLSPDTKVDVFGHNFNRTSQAFADSAQLTTTFVDSTHLTAVIPKHMLSLPARFDVHVITNGVASQSFMFTAYQNKPVLSNITTPGDIMEGNPGTTLILEGTGFLPGLSVKVNGASEGITVSLVDSTKVLADVPDSFFKHGGIFPVVVKNTLPSNVESNIQLLTVYYPSPEIEAVVPGELPVKLEVGSVSTEIEVQGFNFRRGAIVLFNGTPLSTRYCEDDNYCLSTLLFATIPAGLLRESGFGQITIQNPSPTLASSGTWFVPLKGLQPTITSIIPGSGSLLSTPVEFDMPVIVNGTNFGPQTLVAVYPNNPAEPVEPDFMQPSAILSSNQLYFTFNVVCPDSMGTWNVQVLNPPPAGGISPVQQFELALVNFDQSPFLIDMSPTGVAAGGPGFTLTLTGTNFLEGAQVQFSTTILAATVVNNGRITVQIPADLIKSAGRFPVKVINPDTGGASNRLFLDVR
jgi:hypothetical protein